MRELFEKVLNAPYTHLEEDASFCIEREGATLRLLFEWSNGKTDWQNNLRFLARPIKPYKDMEEAWFAHRGFLRVWKVIEPELAEAIADPAVTRIEIAGYSHGAGVALLCYEYCRFHRPETPVAGFGFGAPRVVWGRVPKKVKERLEGFVVVRKGADLVTHLPPVLFGYRHVGCICHIKMPGAHRPVKDHFQTEYQVALSAIDTK